MKKTIIDEEKILIANHGRSINQLAVDAGVSRLTIKRVMDGYPWTSRVLDDLANALGVDPLWLLVVIEIDAAMDVRGVMPNIEASGGVHILAASGTA